MKKPNDPVAAYILANYRQGMGYEEFAETLNRQFGHLNITAEAVRGRVRRLRKTYGDNFPNAFSNDLESNGFDGQNWTHGWLKSENSSIFIRNEGKLVSYEELRDELIAEMKKYAPKYPRVKYPKISDPHLKVIDVADPHFGKLSVPDETGEEYNLEIATKRVIEGVEGLLTKMSGFPTEKFLLVIGNDALHIDDARRKATTSGTVQDTDGMWYQMFQAAKQTYIKVIERLLSEAPVDVVFNPSNHDYTSGYFLVDAVSSWFSRTPNITFDGSIKHRKYTKYHQNLIGTTHGDGVTIQSDKLPLMMMGEAREHLSSTKRWYFYTHHLHHKKTVKYMVAQDSVMVTVECMRSPSPSDGWHHRNGFISPSAIEGFVHHPEMGQVARITHLY